MVVYLHEALDRRLRKGGEITPDDIRQATIAGSVLRLRPKLMTVSVVMAGLVPVMWSTGVGWDIMKPNAGPVICGGGQNPLPGSNSSPVNCSITYRLCLIKRRI